jgi:hypothetical protein
MTHPIHPNFLENADEYEAVEDFWSDLIRRIEMQVGTPGAWPRWIPRTHPNGQPVARDGNPIADGKNEALARAFRVMQYAPTRDDVQIVAWMKQYEPEYEFFPRDELVISVALSDESAAVAEALLRAWMDPEMTRERMEQLIDKVAP